MKNILFIAIFFFIGSNVSFAQSDRNFERIHSLKVGFITDRLRLSSDQSERFWPIYDKYEDEMWDIRRSFYQKYEHSKASDDDDAANSRQYVDDNLDYQQQIIDLKRKYNDDFIKIISSQQLAELYRAETDFKKMLIQQLRERHNNNNSGGGDEIHRAHR